MKQSSIDKSNKVLEKAETQSSDADFVVGYLCAKIAELYDRIDDCEVSHMTGLNNI